MNMIAQILEELKPYTYVVGSYAKGKQTSFSDIDLYVKRRTEEELDANGYYDGYGEEHYIDKVIQIFGKYNVKWDSIIVGHVATKSLPIMIEASNWYKVDEEDAELVTFPITLFGVEMLATIDTYEKEKRK